MGGIKFGINNPSYKHGLSNQPKYKKLHSILSTMRCRCYKKENAKYNKYGKRGIKICNEWLEKTEKV